MHVHRVGIPTSEPTGKLCNDFCIPLMGPEMVRARDMV